MATKKKVRLGRGLDALLGDVKPAAASTPSKSRGQALRQLPIEQLKPGKYQPRSTIAKPALEELAESIRKQGVIQPLLVREIKRDRYEIVAGERRWRAAQLAKLDTVPVIIKEISDQNAMAVALIENIQREDLNAIEEAIGFQRLLKEFGLTHQEVADAVGRSRTAVTNLLRLLALHPSVKKLLEEGKLEMAHARTLLGLPSTRQLGAANKVVADGMNVRQTEVLVKRLLAGESGEGGDEGGAGGESKSADIRQLEERLSAQIGARVSIQGNKKGKVVIYYHSLDELDGIIEHIK